MRSNGAHLKMSNFACHFHQQFQFRAKKRLKESQQHIQPKRMPFLS